MRKNISGLIASAALFLFGSSELCHAQKGKPQPNAAPPAEQQKPVYAKKEIPQGKLEDLVAKVGSGGISKSDYDFYLLKFANKNGKTVEALASEERKAALDMGIDDELVFQDALAEGALRDEYICWTIICEYKSNNITAKIDPESFTEEELKSFYKSRPELFTAPGKVQARGLKLGAVTDDQAAKIQRSVAAKPDSRKDWIDLGWFGEGDTPGGMPPSMTSEILKLKKGQVSGVISDKYSDSKFIFQVIGIKEPELRPFEEIKAKVKFEYISVKSAQLGKKLDESVGGQGKGISKDQAVLDAAISEGYHRNLIIRDRIIQYHLSRKKMKIEKLAPELKKKYKVQVIPTSSPQKPQ